MVEEPGLLVSGTRRIHPLLLVAIPLGGADPHHALAAVPHRGRAAAGAARVGARSSALPFGLLMLVFAIIGGESDTTPISPPPASAFALGLLWGASAG